MMARLLGYLSVLLVAAPVLVFAWAYGGTRTPVLVRTMPAAVAACACACLLLPQRHPGEDWGTSVRRVLSALVRDPLLWVALALFAYLLVPLFNVSLCPVCDWQAIDAGADPFPRFRWLPFCAHAREHASVLWWFGPSLLVALGVRHDLGRAGKRAFLELLVWNAALLALLGFVQSVTGAQFPYWETPARPTYFFSVFGYPNMGGAFFGLAYSLSLGLWLERLGAVEGASVQVSPAQGHPFLAAHYPVVAVGLNLCAVLATLSRGAILLAVVVSVVFFIYVVMRAFSGNDSGRGRRFRSAVTVFALMMGLFAAVYVYAPPTVGHELRTLNTFAVADRVTGKGEQHTRVATTIMRDFPFFGVGGWGYRHFAPVYRPESANPGPGATGGANVHNDYLQFLVEHGLFGFALMVACVWLLVLPTGRLWRQLTIQAIAAGRSGMGASTQVVFTVHPPVLWGFLGVFCVLVHAFGDCPLRSPAVLSCILAILPATFGFMPHVELEVGGKPKKSKHHAH